MRNLVFAVIITLLSNVSQAQLCNSITECVSLMKQARDIKVPEDQTRLYSHSGVIFHKGYGIFGSSSFGNHVYNSVLGGGIKDPSGLIWLSTVDNNSQETRNVRLTQYDAERYCMGAGARLPTKEEFEQLAKFWGDGSPEGYSTVFRVGPRRLRRGI